jgi:hypothetical protein
MPPRRFQQQRDAPNKSDATRLLDAAQAGDRQAAANLLPLVYDELRKLATAHGGRKARNSGPLRASLLAILTEEQVHRWKAITGERLMVPIAPFSPPPVSFGTAGPRATPR